ncbi:MAG: stage II sporulation protein M [Anaerolineales bacterium]|nr:stage II sporulation protein M [Anaerolineales bacterium]
MDSAAQPASHSQTNISRFGDQATWRETLQNALVITRREVRDSFRDWRIIIPIFVLTLFFPLLANFASRLFIRLFEGYGADGENMVEAFLPLMPMIVGFFPVSISLVIALETFVGEKERRSLEPLLSTPLTNTELYLGKVFAATLPPLLAAFLGIFLYLLGQILGSQQWRPDPILIVQIAALTTVQGMVMVTGAVVISSQTTSTRAANLLASTIILPMSLLVIVESIIMIQPRYRSVLWYITGGLVIVTVLLVRTGARIFNREELLGRSVDELNLRWAWRVFIDQFKGKGQTGFNLWRWYRYSVFPTLRSLKPALYTIGVAIIASFLMGWYFSTVWTLPLQDSYDNQIILNNLRDFWEQASRDPTWVGAAISQNVRVLLVASFLGLFTFGVLAILVVIIPFSILGYILGNITYAGLRVTPFILAIVTHGVFEIPAIVIAGAAALRAGSVITRPPNEMTVGEAWLRAIADMVKLGIGLVLPLLIIAGILEVTVTPRMVELAIKIGF